MPLSSWTRNKLLVHDGAIAASHLRAVLARPFDGVIVCLAGIVLVALARDSLASLPPHYRLAAVSGIAGILGAYVYYFAQRRLAFFRSVSVLAHIALHSASAWQYVLAMALVACAGTAVVFLAPEPQLVLTFVTSFCISVLVAIAFAKGCALGRRRLAIARQERLMRILASRHAGPHPVKAAIAGAVIIAAASMILKPAEALPIAAITAAGLGLWYSPVAYSRIEYERLIGMSPAATLWAQLQRLLMLGAVMTAGAMLGMTVQAVAATIAVIALLLAYKGLEILIVRAFGPGRAQFLMTVSLIVLLTTMMILPLLLVVLAPLSIAWLLRAGRKRTWQLT